MPPPPPRSPLSPGPLQLRNVRRRDLSASAGGLSGSCVCGVGPCGRRGGGGLRMSPKISSPSGKSEGWGPRNPHVPSLLSYPSRSAHMRFSSMATPAPQSLVPAPPSNRLRFCSLAPSPGPRSESSPAVLHSPSPSLFFLQYLLCSAAPAPASP